MRGSVSTAIYGILICELLKLQGHSSPAHFFGIRRKYKTIMTPGIFGGKRGTERRTLSEPPERLFQIRLNQSYSLPIVSRDRRGMRQILQCAQAPRWVSYPLPSHSETHLPTCLNYLNMTNYF